MSNIGELAKRYPQKRIIITGATSGLGEALALRFALEGFRVGIAGRNPEKIAATVKRVEQAGGNPLAVQLEVTRLEDFEAAVKQVEEAWGGIDILFNNACIATAGRICETSVESWHEALDTNLWSVIHGCRLFIPLLARSGGGHIVNVASAAGLLCAPEMASYSVSKAGDVALSETLSVELAEDNIDVTVSCPTVFKSGLLDHASKDDNRFSGATADGLAQNMATTTVTSEYVADSIIKTMVRRRLYSVPMRDARTSWRLGRYFPELFRRVLLALYRRRLWIFASGV